MFKRIILLVMDSVGIGYGPDAERFGDLGANTIGHIEESLGAIDCPTLRSLGLESIADMVQMTPSVKGLYGRLQEVSAGKDTTSGHWELMGHPVDQAFPTFYEGFPQDLMDLFTEKTGYGYLGNEVASGTEIIERLGPEHISTGKPIVYTSADSVFQIAAHEDVIPLEELYRICQVTRQEVCVGDYYVGRIIARPFVGEPGAFVRTAHRHDYSRMPTAKLDLERLQEKGVKTVGVGKIGDIYAHVGLDESYPSQSDAHGMTQVAGLMASTFKSGFMMVNLVDFDALYGHRRNVLGYKRELENFDYMLKGLLESLEEDDLVLITADHGNDPTWKGTDHTRERVPLLGYYKGIEGPIPIGDRTTFSDVGATVLDNFGIQGEHGQSFLHLIK